MVEYSSSIDWLRITFTDPKMSVVEVVTDVLGMEFEDFQNGGSFLRYSDSITNKEGITVAFNGLSNMGICLDMSGKGLRCYEKINEEYNEDVDSLWKTFLARVAQTYPDSNIPRLDLCIDVKAYEDDGKHVRLWQIAKKLENEDLYSLGKFKNQEVVKTHEGKLKEEGITIYIGNRKNEEFIRMYNKYAEALGKGVHVDESLVFHERYEIEYKNKKSKAVANNIIKGVKISDMVLNTLNKIILFKSKADKGQYGKNDIMRRKRFKKWVDFIEVDKVDMSAVKVVKNIDKEKWIRHTVKKSLSQIAELEGMDYLLKLVKEVAEEGIEEGKDDEKYQEELKEMEELREYKKALDRLSKNLVDIRLADKNSGKTFDAKKRVFVRRQRPKQKLKAEIKIKNHQKI
ncbi:replication initiation factor domain-containing protein [Bacillus paranthracis]|uniref:replication initiation factor domain-containing protein n=1 Tax=Bacillus paranthracis TaxID=2026186 RepID=UPI0021CE6A44|nr:replication initiation factor domain-containing protein [Bacillus paranthracis]MCU5612332.1 replication initiation factor domain-containing protein [Bacillus paranthracis]